MITHKAHSTHAMHTGTLTQAQAYPSLTTGEGPPFSIPKPNCPSHYQDSWDKEI